MADKTKLVCRTCNGLRKMERKVVDEKGRTRTKTGPCTTCNGTGKVTH